MSITRDVSTNEQNKFIESTITTGQPVVAVGSSTGGAVDTNLYTLIAGEDTTNNVLKTEQRFSYSMVTSDTTIKSAAGFLHSITFACNDSAPTAGNLDVYDNTTGSGTKIFSVAFTTTYFLPFTVIIDATFATGLYADFTTTADVNVTFSYR